MRITKKSFYVTTPIYYVTAKPHLGSLYSTLIADVTARWQKLLGNDVFFLTGTDEHGQKIADAAQRAQQSPKAFVDSFIPAYQKIWRDYDIAYDYFIRTTDTYHLKGVEQFIQKLLDTGDIYKGYYTGWYCIPDETFVTENDPHATLVLCPSCQRPTIRTEEETYFFKLSAYQDRLLEFYRKNPDFFVPAERAHEVINFVQSGLKDLSISRTTVSWGIPFPGDPKHTVYVWADALTNYITAIGYGDPAREQDFKKWWPAQVHVVGKDIVRFHAVYWPAFLMAAGLPLPKRLLTHGWITVDNQKMSKSRSNIVDPEILCQSYDVDAIRYYLLRYLAINQDGDFSIKSLEQSINTDLVNDLGNLLQRSVKLALKNNMTSIKPPQAWSPAAQELFDAAQNTLREVDRCMTHYEFHHALSAVWAFIRKANVYFHVQEPWKKVSSDPRTFEEVISAVCHSLHTIGILLWPYMPQKMNVLFGTLGISENKDVVPSCDTITKPWSNIFSIADTGSLFVKIESTVEHQEGPENNQSPKDSKQVKEKVATTTIESVMEFIAFDDFAKVKMAVGTIAQAEPVEKSDKLLKLQVDFGTLGIRQILSGIAKYFSPQDLIGKQAVFVLNLKPRMMMGFESHGMLLTAEDESGRPNPIIPGSKTANGVMLR